MALGEIYRCWISGREELGFNLRWKWNAQNFLDTRLQCTMVLWFVCFASPSAYSFTVDRLWSIVGCLWCLLLWPNCVVRELALKLSRFAQTLEALMRCYCGCGVYLVKLWIHSQLLRNFCAIERMHWGWCVSAWGTCSLRDKNTVFLVWFRGWKRYSLCSGETWYPQLPSLLDLSAVMLSCRAL